MTRPPEIKELEHKIEEIKEKKEEAIKEQDFERAAAMRDEEKQAKENLETSMEEWKAASVDNRVVISDEDIMQVISKWTGIPLQRMEKDEIKNPAWKKR